MAKKEKNDIEKRREEKGREMTVFGGEDTGIGTKENGFFMVCCKCGWHSMVEIKIMQSTILKSFALFICGKCGNKHRIE